MRRIALALAVALAPWAARAAPTVVGVGSSTIVGSTSTCTPQTSSVTWQDGDLLLVFARSENEAISLSTANSFTEIGTQASQAAGTAATDPATRLAVYWKIANGGGADSMPVVADSGNNTECQLIVFRGTDTGDPFDLVASGNDGAASDQDINVPGGTTTVDDTLVVAITSFSRNGTSTANCTFTSNGSLTGFTEQFDSANTAGLGGGVCLATGVRATAGTVSATTGTLDYGTNSYEGALVLALIPLAGQTYNDPLTESATSADSLIDASTLPAAQTEASTASDALADTVTFPNALTEEASAADSLSDELVPAGGGTPTLVQQNAAAPAPAGTGSRSVSFPGATTSGNMILVVVSSSDGLSTGFTISDGTSNSYRTNSSAQILNGSNIMLKAYWVENAASTSSVTVTSNDLPGANWEAVQVSISEWSGMMTSGDPFDVGATGGGYNVLTTGSTGTTTQASALLVGPIYRLDAATDFTEGTGFTKVHEADSPTLALQYRVLSSTGAVTSEWASASSSGTNQLLAVVFKAGSGGGPATYNDSIAESASGTDALSTAATMASSASEAATATDSLAAANTLAGTVGEAGGAGDAIATAATWPNAASESAAAADALADVATFPEAFADAATAADALVDVHIPGGGGPQVYNDTASEAAAAADAFATVATWESAVSEAGAAGETLATSATFPGVVSEVATSSESFAAAATFPNAQNEASVATDELVAAAVYVESLTETVSAADAQSAAGSVWADALTEAVSSSAAFVDSIPASLQEQLDACRARVKVLERQLRGYLPFP